MKPLRPRKKYRKALREHTIFEKYGVDRQIKTSFGKTVTIQKGPTLLRTPEALHVIDVNSGNRSNKAKTQEDTALEVNLLAASEIARQLRLRDMGDYCIDFIDLNRSENQKTL